MAQPAPIVDSYQQARNGPGRPRSNSFEADPTREYLRPRDKSPWLRPYTASVRALSHNIDDVTADLGGVELYEKRMMRDPAVSPAVNSRSYAAISRRMSIRPAVKRTDQQLYETATTYADFCRAQFEMLPRPYKRTLRALHRGIVTGHKIAELIWETRTLDPADGPQTCLADIKVKPHSCYRLLGDAFENIIGVWPLSAGPLPRGELTEAQRKLVIPASKFAMFINDPEIEDGYPTGTSALRPAFSYWWFKQQQWPGANKFLANFASPSVKWKDGPPNGWTPPLKPGSDEHYTADEWGLLMAEGYSNSSAAYVPYGADLVTEEVRSEGGTFTNFINLFDRGIDRAITLQNEVGVQSQNHSRASGEVAKDMFELPVQYDRYILAWITGQIMKLMVYYNFGPSAVALTPVADLGQFAVWDFNSAGQTLAQLTGQGYLSTSQFDEADAMVGLPDRGDEDPAQRGVQTTVATDQSSAPDQPATQSQEIA